MERGWAINIGGGFHHCSSDHGGGFCVYADITLAIRFLFSMVDGIKQAMIVDLDAHQVTSVCHLPACFNALSPNRGISRH